MIVLITMTCLQPCSYSPVLQDVLSLTMHRSATRPLYSGNGQHSCLAFSRSRLQISTTSPAILTDRYPDFRRFLQSLQVNGGTVITSN
jgi:hypothetical protein